MAIMPDSMRFTADEQRLLDDIRVKAKIRHKKEARTAKSRGRDYPMLPFECSWAFEEKFRKQIRQ